MGRITVWSPAEAEKELQKRIQSAFESRKLFETSWEQCERAVFNTRGRSLGRAFGLPMMENVDFGLPNADGSNSEIGVNYAFKNVRFLHAQLSANPPSIAVRPLTPDAEDRRKAEAAEALKQFFMRQYNLQEVMDQISLHTLVYGTGIGKVIYDPELGEIIDVADDGEVTMEGDFSVQSCRIWDIALDPDATKWEDVRYVVERQFIPYEEAMYYWPDCEDVLATVRLQGRMEDRTSSALTQPKEDVVEVYEYWEKGTGPNGMLGRYAICTKGGKLLEPVKPNPHRFSPPTRSGAIGAEKGKKKPAVAHLPYVIFTDIDVPDRVWGMSALAFSIALQDTLNNLDSAALDNAYAHGVTRMILPEGSEIREGSITNSPWDIVKITGVQPPSFMPPMPLQGALVDLRNRFEQGIDTVFGVNEAMFGQQSRETSGFSMQYATNQGNMIRRRLFNKYTLLVEGIYKHLFNLTRKYWDIKRTIHVLGTENVMQSFSFDGADIDGGFDFVGEYGTNLSLDPITRRQEILSLYPIMKEAGKNPQEVLNMMKMNDFSKPSVADLGQARQREIIFKMISKNMYIAPEEYMEHDSMLAWTYEFIMTAEFRDLDLEQKALILQHMKAREQMAGAKKAAAAGAPPAGAPGAPITTPQEAAPPGPGQTAEQTDVTQLPPQSPA